MNRSSKNKDERLAQRVVDLARRNAATAFPNPARLGCPDPSVLRAMAFRDKRLRPDDTPVSHVATCSPCFLEYTRQRQHAKTEQIRRFGIAFALVVAVVVGTVIMIWRSPADTETRPVAKELQPPELRVETPFPSEPSAEKQAIPLALRVDLSPYSPTRSDTAASSSPILFPAKPIHVTFVMPVGYEPGRYDVRIIAADRNTILETSVNAPLLNGVTSLDLDLDLTALRGAQVTLMIRPNGLGWRTFPVRIQADGDGANTPMH